MEPMLILCNYYYFIYYYFIYFKHNKGLYFWVSFRLCNGCVRQHVIYIFWCKAVHCSFSSFGVEQYFYQLNSPGFFFWYFVEAGFPIKVQIKVCKCVMLCLQHYRPEVPSCYRSTFSLDLTKYVPEYRLHAVFDRSRKPEKSLPQ